MDIVGKLSLLKGRWPCGNGVPKLQIFQGETKSRDIYVKTDFKMLIQPFISEVNPNIIRIYYPFYMDVFDLLIS